MLRMTLRNVLAHKGRLFMTAMAVMLGVAFVSGTLVFSSTVSEAFNKSTDKGFDAIDVAVRPDDSDHRASPPGDAPLVDQDLLDRLRQLPGVRSATGVVSGFTALADRQGGLVGDGFLTMGGNYSPGPEGSDARYRFTDGRAPLRDGEVALDRETSQRARYEVGDTVRVSVDGPVLRLKVVGVFSTDDGNVAAGGSLVLFDTPTAQRLLAEPGLFSEIQLTADPGVSQEALKSRVEKVLPQRTEALTGQRLAADQALELRTSVEAMRTGLLGFAAVSIFVGVFIIANTFTMLVSQRTRELALIRAVGASRRQVTFSVLVEAVFVGGAASSAGLLVGVGIGALLAPLLRSTGALIPAGPLVVSPAAVVISLVIGVGVTALAAWLPSRRAARIAPVAAMSSVHAPATTRGLVLRNTVGSLLAAAGLFLVLSAALAAEDARARMAAGGAVLLAGVILLTPLLSGPFIAVAGRLLRGYGTAGRLAAQNALRNPRRTATTASALMIGLTLVTSLTVIAVSVRQGIENMATSALKADYLVSMANQEPLSPEIEQKLRAVPEVVSTSPLRLSPGRVGERTETLTGVRADTIGELAQLSVTGGSLGDLGGNRVLVDDETAEEHNWKTGSAVTVMYEDGRKGRLTVSGLYEGNDLFKGIMLDMATLAPHQRSIGDAEVLVKTRESTSEATKESLARALGENPAIKVEDKGDVSANISKVISLLLNMLYALLAMAVVVAVLGVVNTLAMSVFERTREIGMLRAVGMDRVGVRRMVRLESVVISMFGGALGVGLGAFLGWAVGTLVAQHMASYEFVLPWGRMAMFLLFALVVGVLAALWPARRAARINLLEAIKTE
ncbi:ABC transporter permease [Streptomyces sp. NPDC050619]|uniref:ABC transporter permease n=1 Tax=Streptomyces sp. NPDC050619 TaxID=3157214 RepID=UPI0034432E0C